MVNVKAANKAKSLGKAVAMSKKKKKVPGKSAPSYDSRNMYKPSIYLEDKQIPAGMDKAKVGDRVSLTMDVKVTSKTERQNKQGTTREVSLEIQKVGPGNKTK